MGRHYVLAGIRRWYSSFWFHDMIQGVCIVITGFLLLINWWKGGGQHPSVFNDVPKTSMCSKIFMKFPGRPCKALLHESQEKVAYFQLTPQPIKRR